MWKECVLGCVMVVLLHVVEWWEKSTYKFFISYIINLAASIQWFSYWYLPLVWYWTNLEIHVPVNAVCKLRAAFLFNQSPNFNNLEIFKNVIGRSMFFVRVLKKHLEIQGCNILHIYTYKVLWCSRHFQKLLWFYVM